MPAVLQHQKPPFGIKLECPEGPRAVTPTRKIAPPCTRGGVQVQVLKVNILTELGGGAGVRCELRG